MSVNIPIAVRVYNVKRAFDFHITKWVEDFTFRHTAPGGCASCTIKLHTPQDLPLNPQEWGKLFTRVQIIDKRDASILWEGRVEDPAQRSDDDIWELGVLGSSVAATDVTMPHIYVDNSLENWKPIEADAYQHNKEDINKTLTTKLNSSYVFNAGTQFDIWTWVGGSANGTAIARVTCTYNATGPNSTQDDFFDQILNGSIYGNLDVTSFNVAGDVTKVNLMPDDAQFADGLINQIYFSVRRNSSTYTIGANDQVIMRFKNPRVQAIRCNRFGDVLVTSADYAHGDFVYVRHVVEDVIGRYLVGNWSQGPDLSKVNDSQNNLGSVKGTDAYVDISDTTKITNLQFTSGATAKDILEVLMGIQPNAYWAIWESDHLWNEDPIPFDDNFDQSKFRFEWATWPTYPNYIVTSQDGMEQQLNAEDCYSEIYLRHVFETSDESFLTPSNPDGPWPVEGVTWDISETLEDQFDRVMFRDDTSQPLPSGSDNYAYAFTEGAQHSLPSNTGTITVRRPIQCFDIGADSHHGYAGMMEPWELRPGKLILIRDLMPMAEGGNLEWGLIPINPNNGFEDGNTGGFAGEGGTFVLATDQKYSGTYSGKITPTGSANTAIRTILANVKTGNKYQVSARVRNAFARNIWFRMNCYDETLTYVTTVWAGPFAIPANRWLLLKADWVAPAGVTVADTAVFMGGSDGNPPATHVLWVDEFYYQRYATLPATHRNCVFRVAATEYDSASNSCKIELDELPKWSVATQIANPPTGGVATA